LAPVSLTLTVKDDKSESYQVTTEDGKLVLVGRTGELAENGDWQLFVRHIDAEQGSQFMLSKRSRLEAIQWLQQTLSISERSKQTGILQLTFEGEDKTQIKAILDDISQNYFLQNVARQSAEAEKSLVFLQ
ncbi:tyrosine-protein kinase, partial [Vibrio alfacsensis]